MARLLLSLSVLALATMAGGETLTLSATYPLDPQLSHGFNNGWHPQGLGFDDAAGELLFAQQSMSGIYRTDLQGAILGVRTIGTIDTTPSGGSSGSANHMVAVAADASQYYFSDYTCNGSCYDLHQIDKGSGTSSHLSSQIAAYGGYPIDVRAGTLYRGPNSTSYNWSALNSVRISTVLDPDTILQTHTLVGTTGMGDIAVDLDGNLIWVLEFLNPGSINTYDLATGAHLDTFPLALDGLEGGLAYGNQQLFYYDWMNVSGSTLTVYDVGRGASVLLVDAAPAVVVLGGTGYAVTVDVENTGANPVDVLSVDLTFTGTADRTSEYTVTPDPGNPPQIGAGVTETFTFAVDVDVAATLETITIDAGFTGTDSVTAGSVVDPEADITDTWQVLTCLASTCGDCNGDGGVSILDALTAAQHSAGLTTLVGEPFSNCNVTGLLEPDPAAEVTILDALTIAQFAAGLGVSLVCC